MDIIFTNSKINIKKKNCEYLKVDFNQLFHPSSKEKKIEHYENVILDNILGKSKFDKIIIKEALALLKKNGNLLIRVSKDDFNTFLKSKIFLSNFNYIKLINSGNDILENYKNYFEKYSSNDFLIIVKKTSQIKYLSNSDINEWSFGIITDGKKDNQVDKIISSIFRLKIPKFEILICGNYRGLHIKKVKIINFNIHSDKGWITKKKNLLILNSKFENCCIIHDRIIFDINWHKGMKKWGNNFEHLGCKQSYLNYRTNDWLINERYNDIYFGFATLIDYKDWDEDVFLGGQMHLVKKSIVKNHWNNFLYWNEIEDYEISKRLNLNGFITRFNPFSKVEVISSRYNSLPFLKFDANKKSNIYEKQILRVIGRSIYRFLYNYQFMRKKLLSKLIKKNNKFFNLIKIFFKTSL